MHIHFGCKPLTELTKAMNEYICQRPVPLKIGARVRIGTVSPCNCNEIGSYHGRYNGCVGEIVRIPDIDAGFNADIDKITIGVRLDNLYNDNSQYGCYWFKIKELTVITEEEKENTNMLVLKGYKVAKVIVDGYGDQWTAFYESELVEGMKVVVTNGDTRYYIGEVSIPEVPQDVTRQVSPKFQVVCLVNETDYKQRTEKAQRARQLEKELKAAIQDYQQIALFEMMAEKSPAIAELLKEYKELM